MSSHFGVNVDGKVLLKTLHDYVGYIFTINLNWRVVGGFSSGCANTQWSALLPFKSGYTLELRQYIRGF